MGPGSSLADMDFMMILKGFQGGRGKGRIQNLIEYPTRLFIIQDTHMGVIEPVNLGSVLLFP
jgi:hypothetical protein